MSLASTSRRSVVLALIAASACSDVTGAEPTRDLLGTTEQHVSAALLQSRADAIKAVHAGHATIHNPVLFAGIAYTETGLAHCYAEYVNQVGLACAGPTSSDCGGAVTAGYWDNANNNCNLQGGGLGMWQFDEGTYSQTLNRWNTTGYWHGQTHNVLGITDSTSAAIDFVLGKAWASPNTPFFPTEQAMYTWINGIRPINGNADYENWLGFLANSYNGQTWGSAAWSSTKETYRSNTSFVYSALGGDPYWYGGATSTQPPGQPFGLAPDGYASMPSGWMTMTWNPVAGATSYEVYILYWDGSAWTYYFTYTPTTNSVTIAPFYHASYYTWIVKAHNAAGVGPQSAWAYFFEQ